MPRSRASWEQPLPGESLPTSCPSPSSEGQGTATAALPALCVHAQQRGRAARAPGCRGAPTLSIPPLLDICSLGRSPCACTGHKELWPGVHRKLPEEAAPSTERPWEGLSVGVKWQLSMEQGLEVITGAGLPGSGSCLPLGPRVPESTGPEGNTELKSTSTTTFQRQ